MTEVALWYWRYYSMRYDIWDSEEEAAGIGAAMEADGGGVVAGVQFPDGRLIRAGEWNALEAARQRRERAERGYVPPELPPQRKIKAPFDGGMIDIDAGEPSWLGMP